LFKFKTPARVIHNQIHYTFLNSKTLSQ